MQLRQGVPEVKAHGQNHLWIRYRKGSSLSGLGEVRIPRFIGGSVNSIIPRLPKLSAHPKTQLNLLKQTNL